MIWQELLYRLPEFFSIIAALATTVVATLGALAQFKKSRSGGIEEGMNREAVERIRNELRSAKAGDAIPFEIEQLASYYSVTLGQAKISFWFSLIFASIGFLVIVGAAFLYKEGDILGASVKITSGLIIDTVAALFFVQSRRAQEAMGAFFEKLRTDRQFIEARKICEEIKCDTIKIKDNLKTVLVLHYSGLQSGAMMDVLAGVEPRGMEAVDHPVSQRSSPPRRRTRKEATGTDDPQPPSDGSGRA